MLPWREEEMVLACSPGPPAGAASAFARPRWTARSIVAFDKGLVIRREVDRFLREHGVDVEVVFEFDNIENIKKAVEIGAGIALLPEPTLRHEVQAGHAPAPAAGRRPAGAAARHHPSPAARLGSAARASSTCCGHNGDGRPGRNGHRRLRLNAVALADGSHEESEP